MKAFTEEMILFYDVNLRRAKMRMGHVKGTAYMNKAPARKSERRSAQAHFTEW